MRQSLAALAVAATICSQSDAQYNYTYGAGFLAAGDDLTSGPYNFDDAVAYCNAQDLCMGFTFQLGSQNSTTPPQPVSVYFKTSQNYVCCDATWATYLKTTPPQVPSINFTVVRMQLIV